MELTRLSALLVANHACVTPCAAHLPHQHCQQVVIFVKSVARARELNRLLNECNFPSTTIHSAMRQEERLQVRTGRGRGSGAVELLPGDPEGS